MSPLILYNGGLLLVDGKLASHASCCCGGACCIPEGCYAEVTALFVDLDPDTGLIFCPSAPPPPPPGYALFESHCEGDTRVSTFRKTLDPNTCENPDPEDTGTIETMEQHFIQVSQLPGPPGKFDGGGFVFVYPTGGCQDGLTQAACESQGGTFYAGKTCADNPCLGTCCIPLCCIFMGDVAWAPNDGTYEPPGGWIIPDAVPGYTYAENGNLGAGWYRNYCPDAECDQATLIADFEAAVQSVDPYAGTDYAAVVSPIGAGSAYSDGTEEGVYCGSGPDGLGYDQATCEELRGTWYADSEACFDNCGLIACCLPDGTCQDMYSGECAAAGGERPGTGLTCFEGTCDNVFP